VLLDRVDLRKSGGKPGEGRALRNALLELPGIGPKTASWITRNWLDADDIAILDVHILRAMRLLSLIGEAKLPRDYARIEAIFVDFARALGVRASILDAVMWQHMRRWGYLAGDEVAG
jgi:thermostable 8-oxoguanine DNA glycosylase